MEGAGAQATWSLAYGLVGFHDAATFWSAVGALATIAGLALARNWGRRARRAPLDLAIELSGDGSGGYVITIESLRTQAVQALTWGVANVADAPRARRRARPRELRDPAAHRERSLWERGPRTLAALRPLALHVAAGTPRHGELQPASGLVGWVQLDDVGMAFSDAVAFAPDGTWRPARARGPRAALTRRRRIALGLVGAAAAIGAALALLLGGDDPAPLAAGFAPARPAVVCRSCEPSAGAVLNARRDPATMEDERAFLDARASTDSAYQPAVLHIDGDDAVVVRARVVDDGDASVHDARIRLASRLVPGQFRTRVAATVTSDARPSPMSDTVDVADDRPVELRYISGSASVAVGSQPARSLSDDVASADGTPLAPDGALAPGSAVTVVAAYAVAERGDPPRTLPPPTLARGPSAAWGPARKLYACKPSGCGGPPYVSLNAYSNSSGGFEPSLFTGRVVSRRDTTLPGVQQSELAVKPGDVIQLRTYFDNAAWLAASAPRGYTQNLRAAVVLPQAPRSVLIVRGLLGADNARPPVVFSDLELHASQRVDLVPVPGSVELQNRLFPQGRRLRLSDELFQYAPPQPTPPNAQEDWDVDGMLARGSELGYARTDGRVAGTFDQAGSVFALVRVIAAGPTP